MGPEQIAVKSCDRCVRKAVCILYHGYTKLELRFSTLSLVDPQEVTSKIGEALAAKCGFYLELDSTVGQV
jgi:hypothetical protein